MGMRRLPAGRRDRHGESIGVAIIEVDDGCASCLVWSILRR